MEKRFEQVVHSRSYSTFHYSAKPDAGLKRTTTLYLTTAIFNLDTKLSDEFQLADGKVVDGYGLIGSCEALREVQIHSHNDIDSPKVDLGKLLANLKNKPLRRLIFVNSHFINASLAGLPTTILHLSFQGCTEFPGMIPTFPALPNLQDLHLEATGLKEDGTTNDLTSLFARISSPNKLKLLALGKNPGIDQIPDTIANFTNLKSLDLHNSGVTPDTLKPGNIPNIQELNVSGTSSSIVDVPRSYKDLLKLRNLYIARNANLAAIPAELLALKMIERIHAEGTKINATIAWAVANAWSAANPAAKHKVQVLFSE